MSRDTWIVIGVVVAVIALVTLVIAVKLARRLLRLRRNLGELDATGKIAFYGALIYTIFPVDLLPDPVYLDDIGILTAAIAFLTKKFNDRRTRGRSSDDSRILRH